MLTGQGENPFPMFPLTREDAASEFPLRGNSQMFTSAVLSTLSTGGALRLPGTIAKFTHFLQFGTVQAHTSSLSSGLNLTPRNPRWPLPSRSTPWHLLTPNNSSINPSSCRWTSVIGSGCHRRSGQYAAYASTNSLLA